jgi:hypothetical protein
VNIYDYFKEYDNKYFKMKDKLVELKESERNFYTLTGSKPSDMPKSAKSKLFDFSNQLERIEKLTDEYKNLEILYLEERKKRMEDINKIQKPLYRTIITLSFIEKKKNKSIATILNKIYKLDYSSDYIKKLKTSSIKEFEKVTFFH